MIYLGGWALVYILFIMEMISRYRGRLFLFVVLFAFAAIAFFRGSVGTDTPQYELFFSDFAVGFTWSGEEPGFVLLGWTLAQVAPSVEMAVRLVSIVFFGLIAWFVHGSDRNERSMLLLYLLPAFAFNYSMNALRTALAFAFIILVVQVYRKRYFGKAVILGVTSVLFHYSALFSLAYLALTQKAWRKLSSLWSFFALIMVGGLLVSLAGEYFSSKLLSYSEYESPAAYSGLSVVIPILIILGGTGLGGLQRGEKTKLISIAFVAMVSAWVLARYSYAGLRILDLLAYVIPLSVLMIYSQRGLRFERSLIFALLLAGLASALGTYYRFLGGYGEGRAPWLPYESWLS